MFVATALLLPGCDRVSWLRGPPDEGGVVAPSPAQDPSCTDSPTWESFGQAWLRTWCTPCHSSALPAEARQGAPLGIDFDTYSATLPLASRLVPVAGGADATMPPAGGPSPEERARLEEWVECGLPGADTPSLACAAPSDHPGDLIATPDACDGAEIWVLGDLVVTDSELACVCGVDGLVLASGDVVLPEIRFAGELDARSSSRLEAPRLKTIAGDVVGGGPLTALLLPELIDLGGALRLTDAPALVRIDLTLLDRAGAIEVRSAMSLRDLAPRRLRFIDTDLVLEEVGLADLDGFDSLRSVGGDVHVEGLAGPRSAPGLPLLEAIGGDLVLAGMPGVLTIDGLGSLERVDGDLVVRELPSLRTIQGITQLRTVGGDLVIDGPSELMAIRGLGALDAAASVSLRDHPLLQSARGFDALTSSAILLEDLPALERLPAPGLIEAQTVSATRVALGELSGWNALTTADNLYLDGNPFLTSVTGLRSLTRLAGDLVIADNPRLSADDAWALADRLAVEGEVTVDGNGDLAE
ncbi:MAG: hypothetical protein ACI9K2_003566 [Myxococcota bacterium]